MTAASSSYDVSRTLSLAPPCRSLSRPAGLGGAGGRATMARLREERFDQTFGRTRNHVARYQLAHLAGRLRTGFDRGADAADIARDNRRNQRAADPDSLDNLHVRGLGHRVRGFHQRDEAFGFN